MVSWLEFQRRRKHIIDLLRHKQLRCRARIGDALLILHRGAQAIRQGHRAIPALLGLLHRHMFPSRRTSSTSVLRGDS
jgi:hypothetical protein